MQVGVRLVEVELRQIVVIQDVKLQKQLWINVLEKSKANILTLTSFQMNPILLTLTFLMVEQHY